MFEFYVLGPENHIHNVVNAGPWFCPNECYLYRLHCIYLHCIYLHYPHHAVTFHTCKARATSVWSDLLDLVTTRAAALWTTWSCFIWVTPFSVTYNVAMYVFCLEISCQAGQASIVLLCFRHFNSEVQWTIILCTSMFWKSAAICIMS